MELGIFFLFPNQSVDNKISGIGVSGFLQCDKESLSSAKNDNNFDSLIRSLYR